MSAEENVALVRRAFDLLNEDGFRAILEREARSFMTPGEPIAAAEAHATA
jgi:hypothetical protein